MIADWRSLDASHRLQKGHVTPWAGFCREVAVLRAVNYWSLSRLEHFETRQRLPAGILGNPGEIWTYELRRQPSRVERRRVMTGLRTHGLSTKVTEDEYAMFEARASGTTVSEWARDVLVKAAGAPPEGAVILAELLAVRALLLNL